MKKKKYTKIQEDLIKTIHGLPTRVQLLGFYKGIPIIHDPEYPTPDGKIYFINDDLFDYKLK